MSKCRTNEKRNVLVAFKNINVNITYYWDDNGKLIDWNEYTDMPTTFTDVQVRLERYSFTTRASLLCKKDFEIQQLVINDERMPGNIIDMEVEFDSDGKMTLTCKSVVGAG